MINSTFVSMRPQDIVVLLKLLVEENQAWNQISLAKSLFMSQSEISESLSRSRYARLIFEKDRKVSKQAFLDLIKYGVPYMYPQQPGAVARGIPTAHSTLPLSDQIHSTENYVWPYAKGHMRGHSIQPLYKSVVQSVEMDPQLYELLALVDALRVGRAREKSLAFSLLNERIL